DIDQQAITEVLAGSGSVGGGAVAALDNLLKVAPSNPASTSVTVGAAFYISPLGEMFGLVNYDSVSEYAGGGISFSAGTISGGGDPFTPYTPAAPGRYFKYGIILLHDDTLALVLPSGDGASASAAPNPLFRDGLPVAVVTVHDDGTGGSGTIDPIGI